MHAHKKIVATV